MEFLVLFGLVSFVYFAGTGYLTLASAAVFAVVVYTFAREQGRISALLTWGPIQHLGRWSYSIYLTHLLVITTALELFHLFERASGRILLVNAPDAPTGALTLAVPFSAYVMDAATLIYVAMVIAFGALMHRLVEVPCRGWVEQRVSASLMSRSAEARQWSGIASLPVRRVGT